MTYEVIVLAAGSGKRMAAGINKMFLKFANIPIIIHTLEVFARDDKCQRIILVVNEREQADLEALLAKYKINKEIEFVSGGSERQYSVNNGLKVIKDETIVLIHDGARPFVSLQNISQLVKKAHDEAAAILAVPVKDTIKQAQGSQVKATVERANLWSVQTPQAFQAKLIKKAHQEALKANYLGTDDASLVEYIDGRVTIVRGNYDNIKITTEEDLYFAEAIYKKEGARS